MLSRESFLASILEKSRTSFSTESKEFADELTVSKYSRCSAVSSVSRASSVIPMIPFMGVRISWLMLAKNSDLRREASSAASLARTISCSAFFRALMSSRASLSSCKVAACTR